MELVKCNNGHFYDADRFSMCPHCGISESENNKNVPINNNQSKGINLVQCPNNHFYNANQYLNCPHCNRAELVKNEFVSKEITVKADKIQVNFDDEEPFIFISYCHKDFKIIEEILKFLDINHFRYWYDEGIRSGKEWADEIYDRIIKAEQFICFISNNTLVSENSKDEIHIANKYHKNMIVIYLEDTKLSSGLELILDRKQALHKFKYTNEVFNKKLCAALSPAVLKRINNTVGNAENEMAESYKLIKEIGRGGTATVYFAENKKTNAKVIIKHGVYDDSISGQYIKEAFETEKNILSKNPFMFLPALIDYYCDSNNIYLIESYLEGISLRDMISSDLELSKKEIVNIFIDVAKLLCILHDNGIIHCDIKPSHIYKCKSGVFLIDFGASVDKNIGIKRYTMATPWYAAPEQYIGYNNDNDIYGIKTLAIPIKPDKIDCKTDIYALGKSFVYALNKHQCQIDNNYTQPTSPLEFKNDESDINLSNVDPLLQAIIQKMIQEKKSDRYQSMEEVVTVLEQYLKIIE